MFSSISLFPFIYSFKNTDEHSILYGLYAPSAIQYGASKIKTDLWRLTKYWDNFHSANLMIWTQMLMENSHLDIFSSPTELLEFVSFL